MHIASGGARPSDIGGAPHSPTVPAPRPASACASAVPPPQPTDASSAPPNSAVSSPATLLSAEEEVVFHSVSTCRDLKAIIYNSTDVGELKVNLVEKITREDICCVLEEEQPEKPIGHLNDEVCTHPLV